MSDEAFSALVSAGARDLVDAAIEGALPPVWFREADAASTLDLLDRRRSVLLVGPAGVGKTAVVHAIARRMADRGKGRLAEISTTTVMSGTKYLGEWETKIDGILRNADASQAVLYLTDVWNLAYAGKTSNSERNLLDAVRPAVLAGRVAILAEATPEVVRLMERTPHFIDLFLRQAVSPLPDDKIDPLLVQAMGAMHVHADAETRKTMVQLTSRYLPARPQPGPALALLNRAREYQEEKLGIGEAAPLDSAFVEKVFSIHTGLPMFVISRRETKRAEEIRAWFRDRIVGQQEAIEAVVETIALFKAGLNDPEKPIGTFLFVGPTGVGKTELARALATFLFGSPNRLLRFDLSELKDYHAFEQLLGNPRDATAPARLVDPVRAQPFQVVLLDEIEKAHQNVWDLLLPLLDEGRLTPPNGVPVEFRRTIVVATSNVGAEEADKSVGFGASGDFGGRSARIREKLGQHFRPEFLNRFQHITVFHPLSTEQIRLVTRQELRRILSREGITGRNLVVEVDDAAIDHVITHGYDVRWGARGLKREVQSRLVLPLAMALMEQDLESGQLLRIGVRDGHVHIRALDTDASREARRERAPVKVEGRKLDRPGMEAALRDVKGRVDALAAQVGEASLREERARLEARRDEPTFWRDAEAAARTLRDLDRLGLVLDRVERLRSRVTALQDGLAQPGRSALEQVGARLAELEGHVEEARRELVLMAPDGHWDALVEIAPIGGAGARDLLVRLYLDWARWRGLKVDWLREPLDEHEPAMMAIRGRYAHGLLRREAGIHRVREGEEHSAARVRVAPWDDRPADRIEVGEHRALKREGAYGGKVRSRLVCGGLVLQNPRTLGENRELALELVGPWTHAPAPTDEGVRRYEPRTPLLRDRLTGTVLQRPDAFSAERLDALFLARLDAGEAVADGDHNV
jgi:ATP-dependent Clp protease ATP-binding subunit ClpC